MGPLPAAAGQVALGSLMEAAEGSCRLGVLVGEGEAGQEAAVG